MRRPEVDLVEHTVDHGPSPDEPPVDGLMRGHELIGVSLHRETNLGYRAGLLQNPMVPSAFARRLRRMADTGASTG